MKRMIGIIIVGVMSTVASALYGVFQHTKRKQEQAAYRKALHRLEAQLTSKEAELASLRKRFGEKNDQVRDLAHKVEKLRAELAARRRSA